MMNLFTEYDIYETRKFPKLPKWYKIKIFSIFAYSDQGEIFQGGGKVKLLQLVGF